MVGSGRGKRGKMRRLERCIGEGSAQIETGDSSRPGAMNCGEVPSALSMFLFVGGGKKRDVLFNHA